MPTPRIIYEGDEAAAHRHLPAAQNLLHKVRTMAAANGAGVTGLSLAPDPDSFIYALKIGDTEAIHVYSAPSSEYTPPVFEFEKLPDILNGVTKDARLRTRKIQRPDGSVTTVLTLDAFKPNGETSKKYNRSGFGQWDRLGIKPHQSITAPVFDWVSQYSVVRPSAYSGRMSKLVQVLLGLGRIQKSETIGTVQEKKDVEQNGVQIQYDYRWHHCHIVHKAKDGRLWLVEISINRGVVAMLLPVYPKKPMTDVESMRVVMDEFKGLPTGQTFPAGKAFKAAVAAGTVLQLATAEQMSDFYKLTPYSSALGWTTTDDGDEAHNTGWYWGEDNIRRSAHFRLKLRIDALKKDRQPNEPIADGEAVLTKVAEGKFYHPSKRFPPPIKFYEPLVGGLASVEMLAGLDWGGTNPDTSVKAIPKCDVTMHVCYIDNQLKLVKYFWDRKNLDAHTKVETNYEPCMYIGAWYRDEISPPLDSVPTFYTTDSDDREQGESARTRVDIVGEDMGRWSHNWGADSSIPYFPQWGFLQRYRTFRYRQTVVSSSARYNAAAIVVPHGMRDGYVYALFRSESVKSNSKQTYYKTLYDPNSYTIYQYWYESYKPVDGCWVRFKYKVRYRNAPSYDTCNYIVDQGQWKEPCEDAEPPQGPLPPKGSFVSTTTDPKYSVVSLLATRSERGTIQLPQTSSSDYYESKWDVWRARSPDPDYPDLVQQYNASYSTLGQFNIAYDLIINGEQKRIGPMIEPEGSGDYNYVGVL